MKTEVVQQEILLLTGSGFSQRQLCDRDGKNNGNELPDSERLERACWDGLLDEMLPEIVANKRLHIWQIWDTEVSLQIELSKYPSKERRSSINPYYFLRVLNCN